MFMPPAQRGGRGRNGGNGNNYHHRMSLPNGTSRLQTLQPQFGSYEYPMAPLSAMPLQPQPYWDNFVMDVLKNQIEYYFSIENLCKDMYLRKRMDSQGFVNLHFIAAFKRIRELTSDMAMLRAVCEASTEIDFVVGEDEIERLRRRTAWDSFVLPKEDRDDFARNDGPTHLTFKNRSYNFGPQFNGAMPMQFAMPPPVGFSPQSDAQYAQFADGAPVGQSAQGMPNGQRVNHAAGTQLSAEVPDFAPSGPATTKAALDDTSGAVYGTDDNHNTLTNGFHTE